MIKPGLLMWIFKDKTITYIRLLSIVGFGLEKVTNNIGNGFRILIGLFSFEFGFHLIKRRGGYVERVKDSEGPKAFA